MRTESCLTLIVVGLPLLGLGVDATRPTKTINQADDGKNCDPSKEQYMHVEGFDYHDHPKFTVRWRQVSGRCGAPMDESDLFFWEESYDGSTEDAPDHPPTSGTEGRVKLNLLLCVPFGDYELDMLVESFNYESTTKTTRVAFEIENGADEYHIWESLDPKSNLADNEDYSPTVPGEYTWPLEGARGFYKTFYSGILPPVPCESTLPSGTEIVGCFDDSGTTPLLNSDCYVLSELGSDGMTAQICSDYCSGFAYFGLESGSECFCGTDDEFEDAVESDQCGITYPTLCTGDATTPCGGFSAISVYRRTGDFVPAPAPTPTVKPETTYSRTGCFADAKADRIMENKMVEDVMSAEICHKLCDDGINTHFGTQYAEECWCAVDPDLTKNGEELELDECDMPCTGIMGNEFCGGIHKITAYKIEAVESP